MIISVLQCFFLTGSVFASWSQWSPWGTCDKECDQGNQISTRICQNNGICDGESEKTQTCILKPCVFVDCKRTSMCITLNLSHLAKNGVSNDYRLDLKDCDPKLHRETFEKDVRLCTQLGVDTCGIQMEMNHTHVNYKNNVIASKDQSSTGIIWSNSITTNYLIPWVCSYPLEYLVSPSVKTDDEEVETYSFFVPKISEVVPTEPQVVEEKVMGSLSISGTGSFPVAMMLYKTDAYDSIWDRPPTLEVESRLHIQTQLLTGPDEATLQTRRCWATATENPNDAIKFIIIDNFCPLDNAISQAGAALLKNGIDFASRWETNVFKFHGEDNIFMHCYVRLCFKSENNQCNIFNCGDSSSRKRRAADDRADTMVSLGPLTMAKNVVEITFEKVEPLQTETECTSLSAETISLVFLILTIISVFFAWLFLSRRQRKKHYKEKVINLNKKI